MNQVVLFGTSPATPSSAPPRAVRPSVASPSRSAIAPSTTAVAGRQRRVLPLHGWQSVAENAAHTLKKGMRVFVAGKLVQRTWQDNDGNKCQAVEIQVTHVGLQFQSAAVGPAAATPAEEKLGA